MSFDVTYTAKRKIKSGHVVDTEYVMTLGLSVFDEMPTPSETVNGTLGGDIYTDLFHIDELYKIATDKIPMTGAVNQADLREFIYSVMGGYSFTISDGATTFTFVMKGKPAIKRHSLYQVYSFTATRIN